MTEHEKRQTKNNAGSDAHSAATPPLPSEISLSQMIQTSPIPTFVINREHIIIHYNRACERLTGLSAAEQIGTRHQWKAFYDDARPVMADLLIDGASESDIREYYGEKARPSQVAEGAFEAEDFFPALGEKGRWLFFTAVPIQNEDGQIIAAIETLQDITDRKQAEVRIIESRKRYRTLLDFVPYPIVVSTVAGEVRYVNPAFTQLFGWTLKEIAGRQNPYIPAELHPETRAWAASLKPNQAPERYITRRRSQNGDVLDVAITAALYPGFDDEPAGILEIMRDVTRELQEIRKNEMILRVSKALPEHPDLEGLLDFISHEIRRLMDTEGALVILLDEETQELYFMGAAYEDAERERRAKEIRFGLDELMTGEVIRTGKPIIVNDASETLMKYPERDRRFGYHTRSFLLTPLKTNDRFIGVLAALNIKSGRFDESHVELLTMLAGSVALSIENARYADEIRKAYREVSSLNRAKGKAINHLSHELKTPVSVLGGSLSLLKDRLETLESDSWQSTFRRIMRNLTRIVQIQDEVADIMFDAPSRHGRAASQLFESVSDMVETLVENEAGSRVADAVRRKIKSIYQPESAPPERIDLGAFVKKHLQDAAPLFAHRRVEIVSKLEDGAAVWMPPDVLEKVVGGLLRNAIENTPDEGRIAVTAGCENQEAVLSVHDFGVGITEASRPRIFEGFFTTRDIMSYSSRQPFDFHAGGKGADLLRMKIFSERYEFDLQMQSVRCGVIPEEKDVCPGVISQCPFCRATEDCFRSGETVFTVRFQLAPATGNIQD